MFNNLYPLNPEKFTPPAELEALREELNEEIQRINQEKRDLDVEVERIRGLDALDLTTQDVDFLDGVKVTRLKLMTRELAVRKRIATEYVPRKDGHHRQVLEQLNQKRAELEANIRKRLVEIGYMDDGVSITPEMLWRHPDLKSMRVQINEAESPYGDDLAQQNRDQIERLEREIRAVNDALVRRAS